MKGPRGDAWRKHGLAPEKVEHLSSCAGWLDPRYLPTARGAAMCVGTAVDLGQVTVTCEAWLQNPVHVTVGVPDGRLGILLPGDGAPGFAGCGAPSVLPSSGLR